MPHQNICFAIDFVTFLAPAPAVVETAMPIFVNISFLGLCDIHIKPKWSNNVFNCPVISKQYVGSDVDVILVGGGSIILPEKLAGAKSVIKPNYFGTANAIGSAISKVSGTYEKLIDYDKVPRDEALAQAKAEAIDMAVQAGAIRETVEIIDVEDVPLAYYPGNTNRVKIKAAGNLAS
jgi:hypothetical protein